jgi:hypothetical protein
VGRSIKKRFFKNRIGSFREELRRLQMGKKWRKRESNPVDEMGFIG